MLHNYLLLAIRKLWRNKLHSLIHILGLTIGVTSVILLFLYIKHELSYDNFFADKENIYRFVHTNTSAAGVVDTPIFPYPFGDAIKSEFPDIGASTLFHYQHESLVIIGQDKLDEENIIFADSNFFKVFSYKVLSGNPVKALAKPNTAFLTISTAHKLFGDASPIGKLFSLDNNADFEVVGLLADPPANTHLPFSMVVSYPTFDESFTGGMSLNWGTTISGYCYVKLNKNQSPENVIANLESFRDKYMPDSEEYQHALSLQPLSDIHFSQKYANGNITTTIDTTYLMALAGIALLILIVACVNFINLASALAIRKSKEVGVRKTLGAQKSQIVIQFLGEAFALTLISVVISLGLVELLLPYFNSFLDKQIVFTLWHDPTLSGFIIALLLLVTILAGLYPSVTLAKFNAVKVLKSGLSTPDKSSLMIRRGLVLFQFLIAQALIIGTIIVAFQMAYFRTKPLGFATEAIVNIDMPDTDQQRLDAVRTRFETMSEISDLTFCLGAPTASSSVGTSFSTPELSGKQSYMTRIKPVDVNYFNTYKLQLLAGHWLTEAEEKQATTEDDEARQYAFVVNEALIDKLGIPNPEEAIGRELIIGLNGIQAPIVGVVNDFHTQSFRAEIEPVVLLNFPYFYYSAGVHIVSDDIQGTLSKLEDKWSEVYPEYSFSYTFLDDHLASLYEEEARTFTIIKIFSGLSIFIGVIGLFGLISFIVVQRMKEIGVRKVLGASVVNIIFNLSKEFLYLELAAFLLALPLTWYFMNMWLSGFAYRIELNPLFFVSGLAVSFVIAMATVGLQAWRAARENPVKALKDE